MKQNQIYTNQIPLTGKLPFHMTNDYLFKFMMQTDNDVLKGIVCSFLDLNMNDINNINIMNTISITDDVNSKEMILDVKAEMNDNTIINLEMQVINYQDWPERSISYLCRCFDNLRKGDGYLHIKGAIHVGFLDYTLFPDYPEFYSTYQLINERTGNLYTGKFRISVVDLKSIKIATEEDKLHHRNLWASFFKAQSWEELHMIANQDEIIAKAVSTVHKLSEDELFREKCWAREDRIRQEIDRNMYYQKQLQEKDTKLQQQAAEIERLKAQLAKNK